MKLLEQIDNYVLHLADVKNLNTEINNLKRSEFYATVEGDLSYSEGDYASEKQYNASVNFSRQKREESEQKLAAASKLLNESMANIEKLLKEANEYDLKEATTKVDSKIKELERYRDLLRKRIKTAYENGDKAYIQGDYKKEKEHNAEYKRLYSEIMELNPVVEGYQEALEILKQKDLGVSTEAEPGNE